ncbi:MAG TPA: threonine/serine exporter family protein [Enterococcus aquimarinus]|nr:threonine/serine exporter family protein [Enterococcus aquimarinus]
MSTENRLLETCLLAGKIMMESGSEVYRVEDTMNRIALSGGRSDSVSYVTATGIFISLKDSHQTQIENVSERSINLEKIVAVNQLSRDFSAKVITLDELSHDFPLWLKTLSAGIVSSTLMSLFGGSWFDFIATFGIGCFGYLLKHYVRVYSKTSYLDYFIASLGIGIMAILAVHYHIAQSVDHLIIGSVMPLVPGVAITTSFRDILAGHMISGLVRGTEAIIVAIAIAVGIATALMTVGGVL